MYKNLKSLLVVCSMLTISFASVPAHAEGFLAGLARNAGLINEDQRRALDNAHAAAGRPLDHLANQAAGAAANYVIPGSGPYVTQGLEMRDQFNRSGFGGFQGGTMPNYGGGMAMGTFCTAPDGRRFGPGPMAPLGTFCPAMTNQFGQVILSGQITQ